MSVVDAPAGNQPPSTAGLGWSIATRFLEALAARDFDQLRSCFAPDVRFRALLPPGPRTWTGAAAATEVCLSWRVRWTDDADGTVYVFEQHAYADAGDAIERMDLLCSGDIPEPQPPAGRRHRFDAGDMGCADGLPQAFRRRIRALPAGDLLEVVASDPAAAEDLPSLARMLGHTVVSVGTLDDGRSLICVEAST